MLKSAFLPSLLAISFLTACQPIMEDIVAEDTDEVLVQEKIIHSAKQIAIAQNALYAAGTLNATTQLAPIKVISDEDALALDWTGDAETLLKKLASDSNRTFRTVGRPLEMPITVNAPRTSVEDALRMIQMQIEGRGAIFTSEHSITLFYEGA